MAVRLRMGPRIEFLIGLGLVLVGVLVSFFALTAGIVVGVIGALIVLGVILPKRKDGTRIWQTDQGKAV